MSFFSSRILKLIAPIKYYWSRNEGGFDFTNFVICSLLITSVYFVSASVYYLLKALNGKIEKNEFNQESLEAESLIFFVSISNIGFKSFKDRIVDPHYDNFNDLLSQIYINSSIAKNKFMFYNKALKNVGMFLVVFEALFFFLLFI